MPPKPRGAIILTHGLAEHSECYGSFAKLLGEDGWAIFAWDLRGHGRSSGKRGFATGLEEYVRDLFLFYSVVEEHTKDLKCPTFLFGHSMGGLITLRTMIEYGPLKFSGVLLSSPALGIAVPVPKIKDQLARFSVQWFPKITLYNEIKFADLTRDEDLIKSYYSDPLRHDKISPGIYLSMVENFKVVFDQSDKITLPTLMQLAGRDRIVSTPAAQQFFERLNISKKELHIYPDSFHEIFNDLDRDSAFADIKYFLSTMETKK